MVKLTKQEIWNLIEKEMARAKKKHPVWPQHIVSRAAIVSEEAGELVREALLIKYETPDSPADQEAQLERLKLEAVQTAVTAIRFLENL